MKTASLSNLLLAAMYLALGWSSHANAYWTTDRNLVNECPRSRRYVASAAAFSSIATYGVCDDCGPATRTGVTVSPSGSGATLHYECNDPSPNYRCEERSALNENPLTSQQQASGEWDTMCLWSERGGQYAYVYAYRECEPGYVQELWNCGDESLLDGWQQPSCRCRADPDYTPPAAIAEEEILGFYQRPSPTNAWHTGVIKRTPEGLVWANSAGVTWNLEPDLTALELNTDPTNPYYSSGYGDSRKFTLIVESGTIAAFSFLGEEYKKEDASFVLGRYEKVFQGEDIRGTIEYIGSGRFMWTYDDSGISFELYPNFTTDALERSGGRDWPLEFYSSGRYYGFRNGTTRWQRIASGAADELGD